jgi:glutamine---fructose-6-phosphate transaminase (isomerizing)
MCGIVGYKGNREASKILLRCIKNLEYRGYDSVGMSILNDSKIETRKDIGNIADVDKKVKFDKMKGRVGVSHTRWATSSLVTKDNAHPHLSQNKKITVVHNGIVENYQELKKFLQEKGYKLRTCTDTEVIPYLIEFFLDSGKDFVSSFREMLLKLEGSYAIVALNEDDEKMLVARNGSPLVLGVSDGEFFAASDVPAFLDYTRNVIYLDDEEYGIIDSDLKIFDVSSGKEVKKEIVKIEWSVEQAKKGDYEHFMLKEMSEQKFTIKKAIEQDPKLIEKIKRMINEGYGVFFVGCGTSYHACVSASYIFSHVAKKHINVVLASEFRNYEHFLKEKTLVIGVSQSGETADLLDAIKFAKKHKCKTISIVNVMGSTLTRLCDENIMMNSGPEICVLSTKSYTSQLAILTLLAYSIAGELDKGKELINEASKYVEDILESSLNSLEKLAKKLSSSKSFFLIGRDLAYPTAMEGALKIKEVSYIHAEGFAGAELKHGTIALIEKGVPCIALATKSTEKLILSNALEVKSRGGFIIGIGENENEAYDYFIKVPSLGDADPILMILPMQVLAYYLALAKNLDPDKPRNLAKSVTVK